MARSREAVTGACNTMLRDDVFRSAERAESKTVPNERHKPWLRKS